jgi:hypothetical protein
MGLDASHNAEVKHALALEVVEVPAGAREEPSVFLPEG